VTDVMTVGTYPEEPLPGPKMAIPVWLPHLTSAEMQERVQERLLTSFRKSNPIHEDPMFFPGNAWKGTSGMPQGRFL
jgi:hypothetical protein